jgi:hypothetical protein
MPSNVVVWTVADDCAGQGVFTNVEDGPPHLLGEEKR